jgi:hypothetical protein
MAQLSGGLVEPIYTGDINHPTIILKDVASHDRWIWHAFFGVANSNTTINVLNKSPLFVDVIRGYCRYPIDRIPLCTRLKRSAPRLQIHSQCKRARHPPHAPRQRARHPPEEGFSVATCPMAQSAPPARKGLQCHHVPQGTMCFTR